MVQNNKAISIRLPPSLFDLIKVRAEAERRSFNKQARVILEAGVRK